MKGDVFGVHFHELLNAIGRIFHHQVNIELLNIDEGVLPDVDKQTIISAYPNVGRNSERLRRFGLEGDGPWRVVLAGYVLHALNRPTIQIRREPYQAQHGDEQF